MDGLPVATPPSASPVPRFSEFLQLVREDWETNGRDWHHPGTQALFAYRLGRFRRGVANPLLRKPLSFLYKVLQRRSVRNGIELRDSAIIGRRLRIPHQGAIVFHQVGVIGDDCTIRQAVTLGRARIGPDEDDFPTLGRNVKVGVGAVLMGDIIIGDDARIGPNCVVTTNVPQGASVMAPTSRTFKM